MAALRRVSKKEREMYRRKGKILKRVLKIVLMVVIVIALGFGGLLGWLTATEYKPEKEISLKVDESKDAAGEIAPGDNIKVMSWNIGYGALGDNADFFMDGGKSVKTASKERVRENMNSIIKEINEVDPDVAFFQEVDTDSQRSYNENEYEDIKNGTEDYNDTFAYNYKVKFIPYPLPPIGKVDAGIATISKYSIADSKRIQLPCPFSWPYRLGNLKRCFTVNRINLKNSDKDLVVVNLHLEAYDNGEGKKAQSKMLADYLKKERDKGNYVIAGGDFNQTFSNVNLTLPEIDGKWHAGKLETNILGDGWQFMMDSNDPSCRSLDQAYNGADHNNFQYYIIDGFIVSDNIEVESVSTENLEFKNTDHNPVVLKANLKDE